MGENDRKNIPENVEVAVDQRGRITIPHYFRNEEAEKYRVVDPSDTDRLELIPL